MKIIKSVICLITFLTLCSQNINASEGHEKVTRSDSINVDGVWRTYEYHVPQFPAENPRLLIVLHGDAMTSKSMLTDTGYEFNKLADMTANTIVVYPQGYEGHWNDCRKETFSDTKIKGVNDVSFIKSIIRRMAIWHHIDYKNVFAVGYLNGGNMCYKLAKSTPDLFKGFAIIGANLAVNTNNDCVSINKPVSMMIMNYNSNTTNPYKEDGMLSTKETIDYWLNLMKYNNQILVSSSSSIDAKTSSTIFREDYFSKEENKRVSLIQIGKDRYSLPYPHVDLWPKKIGDKNKQMSIPETVVQFFYQVQYGDQGYFTDLPTAFKNSESVMGAKITNEHQRE